MSKRTIRTREQRIADAKEELKKLEQSTKNQAIRLYEQAKAWNTRAGELLDKADGAHVKANELLDSIGLDPDEFWETYIAQTKLEEQGE